MKITAEVKAEISNEEARQVTIKYLRHHFQFHDTYVLTHDSEIWWIDPSSGHQSENELVRTAKPIDRALVRILKALEE